MADTARRRGHPAPRSDCQPLNLTTRDEARRDAANIAKLPKLEAAKLVDFQAKGIVRYCSRMIEKTLRARGFSKKEFRARIDRIIADEERTFGQLLELRDLVNAIIAELNQAAHPMAALPNISKIIARPSRFPWRIPQRPA